MTTTQTAQTVAREKRKRLVEAAKVIFHRQGFAPTTLADIAARAQVPLGNVYYYFRTKDELLDAVIDSHLDDLWARFAQWEQDPAPRQRLLSLVQAEREGRDELARDGCPYGRLCQELTTGSTPAGARAVRLLEAHIDWVAEQFRLLGKTPTEGRELAIELVAWLQGAFLLAYGLRSPALLDRQLDRLHDWIVSL
jgi:AcrR family transcriptional regulator